MKTEFIPNEFGMWVINENAQYKMQNQNITDEVALYFWIPDEPIKKYKMSYKHLIEILEKSDKSLYTTIF